MVDVLEVEVRRYKPGTTHKEIFADWKKDKYFEYWKMFYGHKDLVIRKIEKGYKSLRVLVPN